MIGKLFNSMRAYISPAWEFIQRPIPLTIIAVLAGLVGVFYFAPLLLLCEIVLICDFWVYGKSQTKIYSPAQYLIFFAVTSGCLGGVYYAVATYRSEGEQQRLQTMFAADLSRPLTDVYAVLKLDRVLEPFELKKFSFIITIQQISEGHDEKAVVLSVDTVSKKPFAWTTVVPGMQIQAALNPPGTVLTNIFVWDYVLGLNRIELGGYHSIPTAPMILADLNRSSVHIIGTDPVNRRISEIMIVANQWVILDLGKTDFSWRKANINDLGGIGLKRDVTDWRAINAFKLNSLDFSGLIARRRPLGATELPYHPDAEEWRITRRQHGWLIGDKQMF